VRSALLTILLVMLAGQFRAEPADTLSAEQITAVEAGVRASLNNPDSAKLLGLVVRPINGRSSRFALTSSERYVGDFALDGFLRNNDGWSFRILAVDDPLRISAQRTCTRACSGDQYSHAALVLRPCLSCSLVYCAAPARSLLTPTSARVVLLAPHLRLSPSSSALCSRIT
jgi:hypothetical protein